MTYGELKDRVLQLVFSYSIAGDEIELSYNNQEDYVKQIPGLLNRCQSYIYQIKTIEDSILLKNLEQEDMGNGTVLVHLPDDCLKVTPGLVVPRGGKSGPMFFRDTRYRLISGGKMICPANMPDGTLLEYRRRATAIPENVKDNFVLKNPDEVNDLIPFYIAAFIVVYDDAFRYSVFYNEFESGLQRLYPNPTYVEEQPIVDAYGGFDVGDGWY